MILLPGVFHLAVASRAPLTVPFTEFSVNVPRGGNWVLKWIIADYPRTVVANAQTSPNLLMQLFDSTGKAVTHVPIPFDNIVTPAGLPNYAATRPWNLIYPPTSTVTIRVTGQVAGPIPATLSLTLLGMRGWVGVGGRG